MIAIAFTGQDGTGKSTQARMLDEKLASAGERVIRVHQYEPATWLGRTAAAPAKRLANLLMRSGRPDSGSTGKGAPATGPRRRLSVIPATLSLVVGCFRSRANYSKNRDCDMLILDRYYPDEIVRVAHKFGVTPAVGYWMLTKLVPRPQLVISFTVDDRTGYQRKKTHELSFAEYVAKMSWIQAILERVAGCWDVVSINVDGLEREQVFEIVWQHARKLIAAER